MMGDFELLKEVPGYKAILKVVLKSQMQLLIDQLCKYTGEESVILTANASDGAQSILGSTTGKGFLESRSEIKTEFLGHCLKSLHSPEETISSLHNTRVKERFHPYTKSNTSCLTSKSPATYRESNGISEFESLHVPDRKYLNETRRRGTRLTHSYLSPMPVADNNIDDAYKRTEVDLRQDSDIAQSHNMYYDSDYMQGSSDVDHRKAGNDQENSVLMVKQEVESDDVEVTSIEPGQHSFLSESDECGMNLQYNQNAESYDDSASVNSSDVGISDMSTSELNIGNISMSKHNYPCRFCGRVFQHNSWLTRHLRSHTGEKPYECHICGKRFTRAGTMRVHSLMHTLK